LGRIAITILVTSLCYRATQGYIIYFNCNIGQQIEKKITGKVLLIDFPKPKKIFDKNSIVITLEDSEEKIALEVPTDNYYVGQIFTKKMFVGSFGILYSSK
jgi:hypothetical protein